MMLCKETPVVQLDQADGRYSGHYMMNYKLPVERRLVVHVVRPDMTHLKEMSFDSITYL